MDDERRHARHLILCLFPTSLPSLANEVLVDLISLNASHISLNDSHGEARELLDLLTGQLADTSASLEDKLATYEHVVLWRGGGSAVLNGLHPLPANTTAHCRPNIPYRSRLPQRSLL